MKTCETCGKILNDSMEEFRVNGILQCENCAYPDHEPIFANRESSRNNRVNDFWIKVLKAVGTANIIIGILTSIILGVCVYNLVYDDIGILMAIVVVIVGIVLSVISSALLMAFAQLADDVSSIKYLMNKDK